MVAHDKDLFLNNLDVKRSAKVMKVEQSHRRLTFASDPQVQGPGHELHPFHGPARRYVPVRLHCQS